ncbi:hypothetical protein DJ031_09570 [bacterium endosymbiont of Escarpia laminata]|nr:MAG: hypothetical protein DJ031_09570 [bacterium endosymbiont of Escarpia laminata]
MLDRPAGRVEVACEAVSTRPPLCEDDDIRRFQICCPFSFWGKSPATMFTRNNHTLLVATRWGQSSADAGTGGKILLHGF